MGSTTHVLEQLLFSITPSIRTFDFDLRVGFKNWFGSTHVVEQLLFSMVSSILTLDFDLILGSLFTFWGPLMGYFWDRGRV